MKNSLEQEVRNALKASRLNFICPTYYFQFLIQQYPDACYEEVQKVAVTVTKIATIKDLYSLDLGGSGYNVDQKWLITSNRISNEDILSEAQQLGIKLMHKNEFFLRLINDLSCSIKSYEFKYPLYEITKFNTTTFTDKNSGRESYIDWIEANKYISWKQIHIKRPEKVISTAIFGLEVIEELRNNLHGNNRVFFIRPTFGHLNKNLIFTEKGIEIKYVLQDTQHAFVSNLDDYVLVD